jgi:threonine synthase
MNKYIYKCYDCGAEYSSKEVEKDFLYLCPVCGKAERNKPLKGVLIIEYDYKKIRENFSKQKFLKLTPGKFWQYPFLWPIKKYPSENILSRLSLISNPILNYEIEGRTIQFFDDTRNPTLSFKDRASSLIVLKALELGIKEISAASTGNAGSSLAGICARLGIKSHIFVPKAIPEAKRIQIQSYGANIYLVDGSYDDAFDICLEISSAKKIYNRNTAYNPLTIEGKKSAAFDMFLSLNGKLPDYIFIPVGDGVIISGLFKGFYDLKKLGWIKKYPKLIAVQAEGSSGLVKYLEKGEFEFQTVSTIADSISASAPRNLYMAADAVEKTNGNAVTVKDNEIMNAQSIIVKTTGILVEPSSAAAFAGYKKFLKANSVSTKEKIMIMLTGNGLKDIAAVKEWITKPEVYSTKQLKELFEIK